MCPSNRKILIVFVITTLAGSLLHFVYQLYPSWITAVIGPVNESIWEHLKLLFWPYLAAVFFLTKNGARGNRTPWLISLLIICGLLLSVSYVYYILLQESAGAFGPILYVVLMAAGFTLPAILCRTPAARLRKTPAAAIVILGLSIVAFTFFPPDCALFADLSEGPEKSGFIGVTVPART